MMSAEYDKPLFPGRPHSALIVLVLALSVVIAPFRAAAQMQLLQSPGGLVGTQNGNDYSTSFGTLNALAIGPPATGVTATRLSPGAIYFSPFQIMASGLVANHRAGITIFVSTPFAHPSALVLQVCPDTQTCTASGGYSAISANAGAPSTVVPSPGMANNQTITAGIGIFLPDNDGATAFTGTDSAIVTLTMRDLTTNAVRATARILLNAPNERVQDAVELTLSTAPGGVTISPAADFAVSFGNVNGLGIAPGAGLTTVSAAGGILYSTPYVLNPVFTDFVSTTASISVYVSTNFAHPAILKLNRASARAGPYSLISTTAGPAPFTTSARDRTPITDFLALLVSNANGAATFIGADSATLTFTLTVP